MSRDTAGLERLAAAIQETSASQALTVRKGSSRREACKLVGVDPEVGSDALISQILEQNDFQGEVQRRQKRRWKLPVFLSPSECPSTSECNKKPSQQLPGLEQGLKASASFKSWSGEDEAKLITTGGVF
ncbi:hypothetical protein HPB48_017778 [Haemaphysalis longicornis]|uniref:Uncharacterized protein n=1 Tax=Haemaphysalis longicornis TaxID=44386 RepID=A0A9J6F9T5_HAELO|nr:hypothetical protein HPB48_017778 [Haemaphysalis longicornis]